MSFVIVVRTINSSTGLRYLYNQNCSSTHFACWELWKTNYAGSNDLHVLDGNSGMVV